MPASLEKLKPMQAHDLKGGDSVVVDSNATDNQGLLNIGNLITLAEFKLGGGINDDSSVIPSEAMYLVKKDREGNDETYQSLTHLAEQAGTETSDYLLLATDQNGQFVSGAFVPSKSVIPQVGKSGNLVWFGFGAVDDRSSGEFPFKDNPSVEDSIFMLHVQAGSITVAARNQLPLQVKSPHIKGVNISQKPAAVSTEIAQGRPERLKSATEQVRKLLQARRS